MKEKEHVIEAVKFDGKNIQDVFKLPCVCSIHKSMAKNGSVFVYANVWVTVNGRHCIQAAFPGDRICKTESGKWVVES